MDDREVQRVVALRSHLPVAGGLARRDRGARIDVGAAHPPRHRGHEHLGLLDHQRLDDVAAVEHEMLAVLVVEHEPGDAEAVQRTHGVMDIAGAGGIVIEVVRRAERLDERLGQVDKGAAAIGKRDPAAAEDIDRLRQLLGDVVQRLVPGHPPPLAAATLAGPDQRRLRPLVVRLEKQSGRALRAQAGAEHRVVRIALQPGHPTVLDRHLHRATHRAHAAHAVDRPSARGSNTADVGCRGRAHRSSSTLISAMSCLRSAAREPAATTPASVATSAVADSTYLCNRKTRMRARRPASAKKDDLRGRDIHSTDETATNESSLLADAT